MKLPLHIRIINYSLIVAVLFWSLIAASVIVSLKYSIGTLLLWVAIALLLVSAVGVWRYERYYYKIIFVIMGLILGLNVAFGRGVGPEIVPLLLTLYLWTQRSTSERKITA